eukprot:Awhi_evm1s9302
MQLWPEDRDIQLFSLYAILSLFADATIDYSQVWDNELYKNVQASLQQFPEDAEIQQSGINALYNCISYEKDSKRLTSSLMTCKIFVEVQHALTYLSSTDVSQWECAMSMLSYFSLFKLFRDQALECQIHLFIQSAMKTFPRSNFLQMESCKALFSFWEGGETFKQCLIDCNILNEVKKAKELHSDIKL